MVYSWTSPLIPKFESTDPKENPIGVPLTLAQSGLLVSLVNLGLLIGPFLSSLVVKRLGKKKTLLVSVTPILIAHIMCAFSTSLNVFLVARFLMGLTSGAVWTVIPGYLSEISEPQNRGFLNTLMLSASSCGSLFTYLVGPFVSITLFSCINLIPSILFLVLLWGFIPDSPYDLMIKNDIGEAKNSLVKLKQNQDVQKYLLEIEVILDESSKNYANWSDIFKNKGSSKALFICAVIMVFNAFAGTLIVLGYTQTIFDMAGKSMKSSYSAILVGTVAFLSTVLGSQLVDRLGRRPIIITSSIIGCFAHLSLGLFFHFQEKLQAFKWLPICNIICFMFGFNLGLGSLPYVILGELFDPKTKNLASTICTTINYSLLFAITLAYPSLIESVGIANTFIFFSFMLMCCVLFCAVCLPETKGKSFQEIYALLNGKS